MNFSSVKDAWKTPSFVIKDTTFNPKSTLNNSILSDDDSSVYSDTGYIISNTSANAISNTSANAISNTSANTSKINAPKIFSPRNMNEHHYCPHCNKVIDSNSSQDNKFIELVTIVCYKYFIDPFNNMDNEIREYFILALIVFLIVLIVKLIIN